MIVRGSFAHRSLYLVSEWLSICGGSFRPPFGDFSNTDHTVFPGFFFDQQVEANSWHTVFLLRGSGVRWG
jgi:hypothetical protein